VMREFTEERNRKRLLQTATTRDTKTAIGSTSVVKAFTQVS
jgi:hypothetical protein